MKRTAFIPLVCSLFLVLLWSGCDNACKDVSCNNGECVGDGECVCNPGYEGENCNISSNSKFDGLYTMIELCDSSPAGPAYPVTVAPKSGTTNEFSLTGLHAGTATLDALIGDDGISFEIPRQALAAGQEVESISGTISIDAATINVNYRIYDGGSETVLDRCSGSMNK